MVLGVYHAGAQAPLLQAPAPPPENVISATFGAQLLLPTAPVSRARSLVFQAVSATGPVL